MNFEKYTERARGFVQAAQNLSMREGHPQLQPGHLLKVLLDDPEGLCAVDQARAQARGVVAQHLQQVGRRQLGVALAQREVLRRL
ncbi:hypothetical protein FV219_12645, partial [Methylobacterium sp. WL122]